MLVIAFFDICRKKAHVRIFCGIEEDLATQIIIQTLRFYIHGFGRDLKIHPAPGWDIKVYIDVPLEGFELAGGSRPACRINPKENMRLGWVDGPGGSRLSLDHGRGEHDPKQCASECLTYALARLLLRCNIKNSLRFIRAGCFQFKPASTRVESISCLPQPRKQAHPPIDN
jgi:hypothetical protein